MTKINIKFNYNKNEKYIKDENISSFIKNNSSLLQDYFDVNEINIIELAINFDNFILLNDFCKELKLDYILWTIQDIKFYVKENYENIKYLIGKYFEINNFNLILDDIKYLGLDILKKIFMVYFSMYYKKKSLNNIEKINYIKYKINLD